MIYSDSTEFDMKFLADLLAYNEPTCSHLLTSCLATSAQVSADQMLTRRVSTKFRAEYHYQAVVGEGRNKCKKEYKMCLNVEQDQLFKGTQSRSENFSYIKDLALLITNT